MGKRICSFMGLAAVLATVAACSGKPEPAEVVISLDEAVQPLTSATVIVDYSGAAAKPQIAGGEPACFVLPPDVTGEFSDDGAGHLTIEVKARRAFAAPIDLAVCRMIPDSKDVAAATISARLKVALSGATDTKGEKLDDRRLAMTRSGGRDVTSAAPGTAAAPGAASDSGMKVDRESMGSGGNSGAAGAGSGASSEAGSLGEALRNRNTGNPAKEMEREAERVKRETQKAERAERAANGSGTGNAGNSTDAGDLGGTADPDAENDPGVSRATPSYDVTVEIMNNAGLIGALQFDLNHSGNSGGWQGAGGGVRCSWNVSGGITACNDVGSGRARCALADISGFQTPASIVTCTFKTDEAVSASNFNVQVIDASSPDFDAATVNMAVTSVVQR